MTGIRFLESNRVNRVGFQGKTLPSMKLTAKAPLKMDGWNTEYDSFLLGFLSIFRGGRLLLVLGSVYKGWLSTTKTQII